MNGQYPKDSPTSTPLASILITAVLLLGTALGASGQKATLNGFLVEETSIPLVHIVRAAPAKDSIMSLSSPKFVTVNEVDWLKDSDEVLSVTSGLETRAYPLRILVWHEVVNDQFGDQPLAVTYSALSGSAMVFKPGSNKDGSPRSFGISGLLYNSCLLMYDRENEELWSQLKMQGVSGSAMEQPLEQVASSRMTWKAWKSKFPVGRVLSKETGSEINYDDEWPYGDYAEQAETIFPFDINRDEFPTKDRMIAVSAGESARCWPLKKLQEKKQLYDAVGPRPISVTYDEKSGTVTIADITTNEVIPHVSVYWFAWQAFYPDTSVWIPLR